MRWPARRLVTAKIVGCAVVGDGRPGWRDVLLPGILAVALMALTVSHRLPAALTWVAEPGSPLAAESPLATTGAVLGSGPASSPRLSRIAPVSAFGGRSRQRY